MLVSSAFSASVFAEPLTMAALAKSWQLSLAQQAETGYLHIRRHHTDESLLNAPDYAFCLGRSYDYAALYAVLIEWLHALAEKYLRPRMTSFSKKLQLSYRKLRFANQRSRWGSCSCSGTISLNLKLLFVPMALVDYVMLHELCHLRHMNHSKDFWQLLTQYLPDCRQRQVALARENLNIPEWIDGFKS